MTDQDAEKVSDLTMKLVGAIKKSGLTVHEAHIACVSFLGASLATNASPKEKRSVVNDNFAHAVGCEIYSKGWPTVAELMRAILHMLVLDHKKDQKRKVSHVVR